MRERRQQLLRCRYLLLVFLGVGKHQSREMRRETSIKAEARRSASLVQRGRRDGFFHSSSLRVFFGFVHGMCTHASLILMDGWLLSLICMRPPRRFRFAQPLFQISQFTPQPPFPIPFDLLRAPPPIPRSFLIFCTSRRLDTLAARRPHLLLRDGGVEDIQA